MKPKFVMMVGLPGSGKSTYIKKHMKDFVVCSSDKIREELGDINSQDNNEEVFKILHNRIKENLKNGKDVVYDATNISSKRRMGFLNEIKQIDCNKICHIMATPYEKCLENNKNRDRSIPEEVIKKMYLNWNTPYWFEGWEEIRTVYDSNPDKDIYEWINNHLNFNQDNSHHKLTLGEHCLEVYKALDMQGCCMTEKYAGLMHDCGKPFTKAFKGYKGEPSYEARYFNHYNCGAYDSLFYFYFDKENDREISPLDVSILVNLHMQPYFWGNDCEKTMEKYKGIWGNDLFDKVMRLHEVDKGAH